MEKSDKQEGQEYPNVKVLLTPLNFSDRYVECEVRLVAEPSTKQLCHERLFI